MLRRAILAALLLGSAPAAASERLIAEDSIYASGYADRDAITATLAFGDLYKNNVRMRALVRPASDPDSAIGITEDDGVYRVLGLTASVALRKYGQLDDLKTYQAQSPSDDRAREIATLTAALPASPRAAVKSCNAPLEPALATHVINLWRTMLLNVRAGEKPELEGEDGVTIHFSMKYEERNIAGFDWLPWQGSNTARLTVIAANLLDYCNTNNAALLKTVQTESDTLEKQLDAQAREERGDLP